MLVDSERSRKRKQKGGEKVKGHEAGRPTTPKNDGQANIQELRNHQLCYLKQFVR